MKREDIIRMAREAGCHHSYRYTGTSHKKSVYRFHNTELERFAQLVAAAEREACAKVCDDKWTTLDEAHIFADIIRARNNSEAA